MTKLYIHADAPKDLQEAIQTYQEGLDNLSDMKNKADAKTLTRADMRELSQRQLVWLDKIPGGNPAAVGLVAPTKDRDVLRALAMQQKQKTLESLKKAGGPGLSLTSLAELEKLSQMSPETLETKLKNEVKPVPNVPSKEDAKESKRKKKKTALKKKIKLKFDLHKIGYSTDIENELFENLVFIYQQMKPAFHILPHPWPDIIKSEQEFFKLVGIMEENGNRYVSHLLKLLMDAESEVEQETAALALVCLSEQFPVILQTLFDMALELEELIPIVEKGIKYGIQGDIIDALFAQIVNQPDDIQRMVIRVMAYLRNNQSIPIVRMDSSPEVLAELYRKESLSGEPVDTKTCISLMEDPAKPYFMDAITTGLLEGEKPALEQLRNACDMADDDPGEMLLLLGCGGNGYDIERLLNYLKKGKISVAGARAAGIFGVKLAIPLLLDFLDEEIYPILSEDDLKLKNALFESLELITGAHIEKPDIEIEEEPGVEEYKVKILLGYHKVWTQWWENHRENLPSSLRCRRGRPFTMAEAFNEMKNPAGYYWTRQVSYYELMIRSGIKQAFEADWYVPDQLSALDEWQAILEKKGVLKNESQFCFAGRQ